MKINGKIVEIIKQVTAIELIVQQMQIHCYIILEMKPTWCTIFLSMFISFLYMFRATMCPSSEEITVSMQHLVFVTLCG